MRISDWSSDVCSSDLHHGIAQIGEVVGLAAFADAGFLGLDEIAHMRATVEFGTGTQACERADRAGAVGDHAIQVAVRLHHGAGGELHILQARERADAHVVAEHHATFQDHRSEEHTSELQSLMRTSYAVLCLKKKNEQPTPGK